MLRYVYFLDKSYRSRLTCKELPFSEIDKVGGGMYKGKRISQAERHSITTEMLHDKILHDKILHDKNNTDNAEQIT